MTTLLHEAPASNPTLEPLDLVDDFYFDEASDYIPTAEDLAELAEIEHMEAEARDGSLMNLGEFVRDMAGYLRSQELPAEHWLADQLDQLARRVEFLGATTIDQYEVRNATVLRDTLTVRPSNRVGHYRAWDVVDGLGGVQACSDLFDAMMWIQRRIGH